MSGKRKKSLMQRLRPRAKKRGGVRKTLAPMIAVLGLVAMSSSFIGAPAQAEGGGGQDNFKVFVCKYVGQPGVDERLQTGDNPISVSVNSIPNYQGVGSYFADQHGRSFVLAVDDTPPGPAGDPGVGACPPPQGPPHDECPNLPGNQPAGTDCTPPPVDVCPNLPGNQPEGTDCTPPPTDACPNLPGDQPAGTDCNPPPHDECPNLPGNQPAGTDCTPPPVDVCPNLPGNQPEGSTCDQPVTGTPYAFAVQGSCDAAGYIQINHVPNVTWTIDGESVTVSPPSSRFTYPDGIQAEVVAVPDEGFYFPSGTVDTFQLQVNPQPSGSTCEPPPEECPNLTGSVKTTLADGSVVNGNIYQDKSDVYVSGSQLGDVSTVYIRVTDPSGSTVLSETKQVSVTDGSFGPVQLPAFGDSPNNGDEYKVWVSSSPDFEQKCTKFDNFKVRGDEPPPSPEGMSRFSVDCESLEIKAPTGVKPEDAEYQYYLDGQAIEVGSHELAPGDYTLTLEVDGKQVDSDAITVEECEQPPSYVVTVVPNQGNCDVRTPVAQVTTGFASSIGYRLVGGTTKFVYTEVPAGTYALTLPGLNPGDTVSYEVVVTPLDDSAQPVVKGPFSFSVPKDCDEVPPCIEFQDEDAAQPCYVEREPDVREKSSVRESCKLGGVVTTSTVHTTTYSFNEETQQWETSETATSSQSFDPYSAAELKEKGCVKQPPPDEPDTPTTPTGLTGAPDTGLGGSSQPSYGWVMLALAGLLGFGSLLSSRRRAGANR